MPRTRDIKPQVRAMMRAAHAARTADPDQQNDERAQWAAIALLAFIETTGCDFEDCLADLLADLRHFCDRHALDWEKELARAMGHYYDETADEPAP